MHWSKNTKKKWWIEIGFLFFFISKGLFQWYGNNWLIVEEMFRVRTRKFVWIKTKENRRRETLVEIMSSMLFLVRLSLSLFSSLLFSLSRFPIINIKNNPKQSFPKGIFYYFLINTSHTYRNQSIRTKRISSGKGS